MRSLIAIIEINLRKYDSHTLHIARDPYNDMKIFMKLQIQISQWIVVGFCPNQEM